MNIGIVANSAFNIYNFRLGLIKALMEDGHQVVAIAPYDEYVDLLKKENIDFVEIKNLSRKGMNPFMDLTLMNEFRKIYKEQKLDAVLQYTIKPNIYGTLAARLTKTKTICTVTGLGYTFLNKNFGGRVAHRLYRFAFSFADKVLFQNQDDLQTFIENKLVNVDKTGIVQGSGIDTQYFHPEFCGQTKKEDTIRFLMIARLLKDKGIYEYIEAAKQIQQKNIKAEFHLLGEIDNENPSAIKKAELQDWIDKKIIYYHGHTRDTRPFICMADSVVLPSYREGMPRVILEGMAMGKLCITSDAPGCRDAIIDDESGLICKTGDATSLEQVMEKFILLNGSTKNSICKAARERAEKMFSNENIFEIYLLLLRNHE